MILSQSQLQKLGERLRTGANGDDLRVLVAYKQTFGPASDAVAKAVLECTGFIPMQRAAKSTQAILEKLRRQSTRLGSIQDIAGCRVTVPDSHAQTVAVAALMARFPDALVKDRRVEPSHGYRAVHVIVRHEGFRIEVQVRTMLQHTWALMSEMLADRIGNELKYGGGPSEIQEIAQDLSLCIGDLEALELEVLELDVLLAKEAGERRVGLVQRRMLHEARLLASRTRLSALMLSVPTRTQGMVR